MENKELNRALRDRARELGLCDQWYKEWDKNSSKQELIKKYLDGIDFCIKHDYPNIEFAKAYFPKNLLKLNCIFIDDRFDIQNANKVVTLGKSSGRIQYEGLTTGDVYVRHQSLVEVNAKDGARVFVEVYDGAHLIACSDDMSKIFVYDHGGDIETYGNVTVRDKRDGKI